MLLHNNEKEIENLEVGLVEFFEEALYLYVYPANVAGYTISKCYFTV